MARNYKRANKGGKSSEFPDREDRRKSGVSRFSNRDRKSFDKAVDKRECMGSKDNDPAWYSLNPQLLKDAASFPYAWPLGLRLNVGEFGANVNAGSLPGIFAMHWVPTIGYSNDGTSPINVASVNIYTKVRHDNSGHANYDHADYMMYLMAMDSVYAFHSWMRRAYGTALTYSNVNRYFPRAAVAAMGVNFDDIQRNLADFRQYINMYAVKASALAIPKDMSIMTKHYWMSEGMYFDSQQDKPQTYMFNPLGFYKFTIPETGDPIGSLEFAPLFGTITAAESSELVGTPKPSTWRPNAQGNAYALNGLLTLADIVAYGDALLAPIIADEDFGIMSGDTLKSFGVGGCYTLPMTEEAYAVAPSYSEEVLDQIQNATLIGMPVSTSLNITQDARVGKGWIITNPKFRHPWTQAASGVELPGQNAFLVNRFLTFTRGDIDPARTMEASRWTNIGTQVTDANTREYTVSTMGSEVMCSGAVVYYAAYRANPSQPEQFDLRTSDPVYVSMNADVHTAAPINLTTASSIKSALQNIMFNTVTVVQRMLRTVQQLSVFDRHPAVYLTSFSSFEGNAEFFKPNATAPTTEAIEAHQYGIINGVLLDVNYYTILSANDLEEMSHIALLSEFNVTAR